MVIGFKPQFVPKIMDGTKKHTIREDKTNRWKVGMKMHMATGVSTKKYHEFNRESCKGIESIIIRRVGSIAGIFVAGELLSKNEAYYLALRDGFDSLEDFFKWFNKDFEGKILHWTDFKYRKRVDERHSRRRYHLHNMLSYRYNVKAYQKIVEVNQNHEVSPRNKKYMNELAGMGYNIQYVF